MITNFLQSHNTITIILLVICLLILAFVIYQILEKQRNQDLDNFQKILRKVRKSHYQLKEARKLALELENDEIQKRVSRELKEVVVKLGDTRMALEDPNNHYNLLNEYYQNKP